ncbi:MAG TPA: dihydrolipoamide acetyltransferase family protein, partial [Acidimicrobiia bacterium]|nr:dihydrolipoamide acetyltransferase family protein [Acidimicrobiia bacterium]
VVLEGDGVGAASAPSATPAPSPPETGPPGILSDPSAAVGRPKAAPAVRKLAVERGVDLATIAGSGPGGRILATDVEAAARPILTREPAADRPAAGGIGWMEAGRHPLRGIRRVTAEAMSRSWAEIPHLTTLDEIDATGLLAARRSLAEAGLDATIGALLVAAVARGLHRHPVLNASLEVDPDGGGGEIVVHPDVNVGLAVATAEGLVVPVIRNADRRSLGDLAAEVRRLTAAARSRKADLADLRGGTFTISNYGALGGRYATPIIRPPEVAIMGFGAIRPRPFVVDGEVRARPTLPWSLSCDHRLIDGDVATAFAEYVLGLLADPVALLAQLLAG